MTQPIDNPDIDPDLEAIGDLADTDGNFIVGNGSTWVAESGGTARTSLGAAASGLNGDITRIIGLVDGSNVAPAITFTSDDDTGVFLDSVGVLGLSAAGSTILSLSSSGATVDSGQLLAQDGTNSAPSLSFGTDTDTGAYRGGTNNFAIAAGGSRQAQFFSGGLVMDNPISVPDGSASTPAIYFNNDTDTGLYSITANQLGFSAGGTLRTSITTTGLTVASGNSLFMPDGSASSPSLRYTTDDNTGLYLVGADQLGLVSGGGLRAIIENNGLTINDGFLKKTTTAGITASTTQTQGQGALTTDFNEVSTVANTNDTVTLPSAVAGMEITIFNNGANTLQIFPASSDNLGAGVDTATTLASGSNARFCAYDATNWEQII